MKKKPIKISDLSSHRPSEGELYFTDSGGNDFKFNTTPSSFMVTGTSGETILEITPDGDAIWHKPEAACEAADVFSMQVKENSEHAAGIKQSRKDWEDQKLAAISGALRKGTLTEETLIEIIRKHEFLGRLSGDIS